LVSPHPLVGRVTHAAREQGHSSLSLASSARKPRRATSGAGGRAARGYEIAWSLKEPGLREICYTHFVVFGLVIQLKGDKRENNTSNGSRP
jgi:hypothetical protein